MARPGETAEKLSPRLEIAGGWFEPDGHIYRDALGNRVLSVTQVLQSMGLVDYRGVRPDVLQHKSEIGIAVHRSVELLLQKNLDWDTVDEAAMNYVVGTELWLRDMRFELESCEQQGVLDVYGMKIGYQYDLLGRIWYQGNLRPVIVDLKTAVQTSVSWALQTAAYALAARRRGRIKTGEACLRVVLHLQKDGRVKPLYYDDPDDERTFLYMAYCATWKQNHGYEAAA